MQKVLVSNPIFHYNTAMTETTEFANYCGQTVIVLSTESTEYGTLSMIQYEDGREEEVPTVRLNFL